MSTLTYAALTTVREKTTDRKQNSSGSSPKESPPAIKTYIDAFAALVPAEVLALHSIIISITTKTTDNTTEITNKETLTAAFWGLIAVSILLYVFPRLLKNKWEKSDYFRALIPPAAFVGWTMLQKVTAFHAIDHDLNNVPRTVIPLFLGVILGLIANALAYKADPKSI